MAVSGAASRCTEDASLSPAPEGSPGLQPAVVWATLCTKWVYTENVAPVYSIEPSLHSTPPSGDGVVGLWGEQTRFLVGGDRQLSAFFTPPPHSHAQDGI